MKTLWTQQEDGLPVVELADGRRWLRVRPGWGVPAQHARPGEPVKGLVQPIWPCAAPCRPLPLWQEAAHERSRRVFEGQWPQERRRAGLPVERMRRVKIEA